MTQLNNSWDNAQPCFAPVFTWRPFDALFSVLTWHPVPPAGGVPRMATRPVRSTESYALERSTKQRYTCRDLVLCCFLYYLMGSPYLVDCAASHPEATLGNHQLWFHNGLQPLKESQVTRHIEEWDSSVVVTKLLSVFLWNGTSVALFHTLGTCLVLSIPSTATPTASQSLLPHHSLAALAQSCHLLLTNHFKAYLLPSLRLPSSLLVHPFGSVPPNQPVFLLQLYCAHSIHSQSVSSNLASFSSAFWRGWPVSSSTVSLCCWSAASSSRRSPLANGASCLLPFPALIHPASSPCHVPLIVLLTLQRSAYSLRISKILLTFLPT